MKLTLEYNFTAYDGTYCERIKEASIERQATPSESRKEALRVVYQIIPEGVAWRMEAMEAGKVILTAWGYGHALDGYTMTDHA